MLISIGLFLVRCYIIFNMNLIKFYYYCCENNSAFRRSSEFVRDLTYTIRQSLCSYRLEPPYDYWSVIYTNGDKYDELVVKISSDKDPISYYNSILEGIPISNYLLIMRYGIFLSRVNMDSSLLSNTRTQTHFLSIEYSHPDMDYKIPIELDVCVYLEGNEILSKYFVRRCLEYQPKPFVFDDNYKLEIMDSNIKMLELKSDQYVVLGKTDYTIQ
jgi:hypothetical protein